MDDDWPGTAAPRGIRPPAPVPGHAGELAPDRIAAFSAFYRAQMAGVVSLVIFHGATFTEAADAAQTVMEKAWQQWDQLRDPRAWVYAVAPRLYLKSIPRHEALTDVPPDLPAVATDLAPDLALEISEQVGTVLQLLAPSPSVKIT